MSRIRRGDRRALRALYGRYAFEVYDFAACFGERAAPAVVEGTFRAAYDRLRLGIRPQRAEPWLLAIARGLAVEGGAEPVLTLPTPREGDEPARAVRRWAEGLRPRDYALLDLYVRRGLTVRELGALVGSGQQVVRTRIERLTDDLRDVVAHAFVVRRKSRCLELLELLDRVRGREGGDIRAAARMHARHCPACGAAARGAGSPLAVLADLPERPLPAELAVSIWAAVAAHAAGEPVASSRSVSPLGPLRLPRHRRLALASMLAASAALAALVLVLADPFGGKTPPARSTAPRLQPPVSVFLPPLAPRPRQGPAGRQARPVAPAKPAQPDTAAKPAPQTGTPASGGSAAPPPPAQSQDTPTKPKPSAGTGATPAPQQPATPAPQPPPAPAEPTPPAPAVRTLAWAPVPDAVGYELVLMRGSRLVYKERTREARLTIPQSSRVDGKVVRLTAGYYRWIVWPLIRGEGKAAKAVVVAAVHLD